MRIHVQLPRGALRRSFWQCCCVLIAFISSPLAAETDWGEPVPVAFQHLRAQAHACRFDVLVPSSAQLGLRLAPDTFRVEGFERSKLQGVHFGYAEALGYIHPGDTLTHVNAFPVQEAKHRQQALEILREGADPLILSFTPKRCSDLGSTDQDTAVLLARHDSHPVGIALSPWQGTILDIAPASDWRSRPSAALLELAEVDDALVAFNGLQLHGLPAAVSAHVLNSEDTQRLLRRELLPRSMRHEVHASMLLPQDLLVLRNGRVYDPELALHLQGRAESSLDAGSAGEGSAISPVTDSPDDKVKGSKVAISAHDRIMASVHCSEFGCSFLAEHGLLHARPENASAWAMAAPFVTALFGGRLPCESHRLVVAHPLDACMGLANPSAVQGAFTLVQRGGCTFTKKAMVLQAAGGAGMFVFTTDDAPPIRMAGQGAQALPATSPVGALQNAQALDSTSSLTVHLPCAMVSHADGEGLLRRLQGAGQPPYVAELHTLAGESPCSSGTPSGLADVTAQASTHALLQAALSSLYDAES